METSFTSRWMYQLEEGRAVSLQKNIPVLSIRGHGPKKYQTWYSRENGAQLTQREKSDDFSRWVSWFFDSGSKNLSIFTAGSRQELLRSALAVFQDRYVLTEARGCPFIELAHQAGRFYLFTWWLLRGGSLWGLNWWYCCNLQYLCVIIITKRFLLAHESKACELRSVFRGSTNFCK